MLKPGVYYAKSITSPNEYPEGFNPFDDYEIEMRVVETDRAFILTLERFVAQYAATQVDDMFRGRRRVTIKKNGGRHALRVWSDVAFTLYPYRVGVPFYFELREKREDAN